MIPEKYRQFAVIFTLCALGALSFGSTPSADANGNGVIRHIELQPSALGAGEMTPEQLGRANPRPKYDRGLPTVDLSEEAVQAKKGETPPLAPAPSVNLAAGRKIDYVAISQPVEQVMRELGQEVGLRVVPGPGISGLVRKRRFKGEFTPLMDKLAQEYNLFWFADGGVVYVDGLDDQKTKLVKLKNISREQIHEAMNEAGMGHVRSRVMVSDGNARVTGPESFQKAVESLLASLSPPEDPDVKIIKYGAKVN